VIYVASAVSIEFVIGLGLALIITAKIKGLMFIRVALLVPLMITPVVAGVLWRFLFNPEYGVVNYLIQMFGGEMVTWLARPNTAFMAIIIVEVWQQLPVVIFILAAGISSLPETIYESAMIDGASSLQKFRYITLPLLKSVIAVVLLLRIMDAFKIFDVIYTLTYGGPGKSTEVVSLFVYKQGLKYFQIGSATAMSWVFLILVLIISLFFMRQVLKEPA
jgi:multiple sugar transport system permease protein